MVWQGKCPVCGEWNTFKEFTIGRDSRGSAGGSNSASAAAVRPLSLVGADNSHRLSSGLGEFDRALGGGFVLGSVILLGGDPGIGKSTVTMQIAHNLANDGVIYFSGEESEGQVANRALRLGLKPSFKFANITNVQTILATIEQEKPKLVIIDSIQTLYDDAFPSTPGSLVQVRESSLRLQELAKRTGTIVILIGHVTKEGSVAGPRTLEHMVDVVLYLEGDRRTDARILRGAKNRFGATHEIGLFRLTETGMEGIDNPSVLFMSEHAEPAPGTILTAAIDGSRPVIAEIQSLVTPTAFGLPRRTSSGIDLNRLHLLIAIVANRAGLPSLGQCDVFLNIVGGYTIHDRAADLAVCLALASGLTNVPLPLGLVAYGEVDLTGSIRPVPMASQRASEAKRLGLSVMPENLKTLKAVLEYYHLRKTRSHAD